MGAHPRAVACLNTKHLPTAPRASLLATQKVNLETRFRLLRTLQAQPDISQRALAQELGFSLGKVNYCVQALVDKGLLKVANFNQSRQKHRYLYQLTPAGIAEKARITSRFLKRKLAEHEALTREIEQLRREAAASATAGLDRG